MSTLRVARRELNEAWRVIEVLRAPALVSIVGFFAFSLPGQTIEVYKLFSEDFRFEDGLSNANVRFALFFVLLWVNSYVIWYVSRVLTLVTPDVQAALKVNDVAGRTARWGPRIFGALPCFGAAIGLFRATDFSDPEIRGLAGGAALAAFLGVVRLWSTYRRSRSDPSTYDDLRNSWLRSGYRWGLALVFLAVVGYLMTSPIDVIQWIGALSLMCIFSMALVFGAAQLTYVYDRRAIPLLTLLVGGAIIWSMFDLNDNHFVRHIPRDNTRADTVARGVVTDVETAFDHWLRSRADFAAYEQADKPYPVYIIAAQGGGLYAAYQTATFLARLQDACPTFAQHIFAISGVSGGAVGATVFTALAKRNARNEPVQDVVNRPCNEPISGARGSMATKTKAILEQDFLSPLLNGMLFSDFAARFSPIAIPPFDRTRALEEAFEQAWNSTGDVRSGNPLQEGVLSYWSATEAAPLLLLNTTEVETGRRLIITPIQDLGGVMRSYVDVVAPNPTFGARPDMRLSTAMVNSARFPFVTPAGSVTLFRYDDDGAARPFKARLVDGGYFENSGIDTAVDLIRVLRESRREQRADRSPPPRIDIRLIVFDLTGNRYREPPQGLGEVLSPIRTILNARTARAFIAQDRARRALRAIDCRYLRIAGLDAPGDAPVCGAADLSRDRVWSVSLNDYESDFQLGWILSRRTFGQISRQLGAPELCEYRNSGIRVMEREIARRFPPVIGFDGDPTSPEGVALAAPRRDTAITMHNSCVAHFVVRQLRRDDVGGRLASAD